MCIVWQMVTNRKPLVVLEALVLVVPLETLTKVHLALAWHLAVTVQVCFKLEQDCVQGSTVRIACRARASNTIVP